MLTIGQGFLLGGAAVGDDEGGRLGQIDGLGRKGIEVDFLGLAQLTQQTD